MGAWEGPGEGVTKQDPEAGRMEHPPGNPGALLCSQPQLPAFLLPTPQLTNPSGCPACPEPLAQMLWLAFHPHAPSPAFSQLTKSHPASHLFSALAGIGLAGLLPVWDSPPCLDPSLAVHSQVLAGLPSAHSSLTPARYMYSALQGLGS